MTTTETTKVYEIDATGKRLGVVSTEAAKALLGKNSPDFAKNKVADVTVRISNASKLQISEKKKDAVYQSYSGYPGGRRTETLEHLANRLGYAEAMKRTIAGMLPNNKLKKQMLKQLIISE